MLSNRGDCLVLPWEYVMTYAVVTRLAASVALGLLACASASVVAASPVFHPSSKYSALPFSEAVAYGGLLFLSGDLGAGPDGRLVAGGIGPETRQTMENIRATLSRHGLEMSDIVKCTVFLADIGDWPAFNEIYATYFENGRYPARSALAASGLALGARVELDCIAAQPDR